MFLSLRSHYQMTVKIFNESLFPMVIIMNIIIMSIILLLLLRSINCHYNSNYEIYSLVTFHQHELWTAYRRPTYRHQIHAISPGSRYLAVLFDNDEFITVLVYVSIVLHDISADLKLIQKVNRMLSIGWKFEKGISLLRLRDGYGRYSCQIMSTCAIHSIFL